MVASPANRVVQHLRRAILRRDGAGLTDGQLLQGFVERHDGAAFETLVLRHGPMVLGVCRRLLGNPHDAEDAFQATFLVLVRKADSVVPRDMVGNWLYGVAYQTALKARALALRRRARERQVLTLPETAVCLTEDWSDLQPVLDQELSRLPSRYRIPILLCDVQGMTRKEAAQRLGWPEGTLSSRLARARGRLAQRLTRRGVVFSGGSLAAVVSQQTATAHVPASLVSLTVQGANLVVAGKAATVGALSAPVVALTEGVVHGMLLTKIKVATAVILMAATLGVGGSEVLSRSMGAGPQQGRATGTAQEPGRTQDQGAKQPEDLGLQILLRAGKDAKYRDVELVLSQMDRLLYDLTQKEQQATDDEKKMQRKIELLYEGVDAQDKKDQDKRQLLKEAEMLLSLSRKEDENLILKKKLADLEVKVASMEQANNVLRDRVEGLSQAISQLKKSAAAEGTAGNVNREVRSAVDLLLEQAYASELRGSVLRVADGLAVISKGSEQGVQVGQKLYLYRTEPQPTYLGEIEILKTEPGQAVGRIQRIQGGKAIQPGDRVTNHMPATKPASK